MVRRLRASAVLAGSLPATLSIRYSSGPCTARSPRILRRIERFFHLDRPLKERSRTTHRTTTCSASPAADDLAFSGGWELERPARRLHVQVAAIALEEGFAVHARKTRVMREGSRQRLAGVVVNRHPNLARRDFDRLKAILHNCVVSGPHAQNRAMHAAPSGRGDAADRLVPEGIAGPLVALRIWFELTSRIAVAGVELAESDPAIAKTRRRPAMPRW